MLSETVFSRYSRYSGGSTVTSVSFFFHQKMIDEEKQGLLSPTRGRDQDLKEKYYSKGLIIEQDWCFVKVPSTGLRQINGIASGYSTDYPPQLNGIVSKEEYVDIITRLNDTIRSYWPCNLCYFFGYGCSICTCGASLLCPQYCMSHSEQYANEMLKNVSLKSKYWERKITFKIVKGLCASYVEIRFPVSLIPQDAQQGIEEETEIIPIDKEQGNWGIVKNQPSNRLKAL